ncbi:dockerin type I domain-containing protein [Desulfosarcina sp.]|uniref:dockerin type I domain-containing protein n=1 Tax=Desulfosarcina sp. TaxID=2027861 RepID=UPI00356690F3
MPVFNLAMRFTVFLLVVMLPQTVCHALDISIDPLNAQRRVGNHVTVYIYATNAIDLISMGVKASFNPRVLEAVEAHKYEDFDNGWVMDADADPDSTNDQFTLPAVEIVNYIDDNDPANDIGEVIMIGGRLMGDQTAGLTAEKLLLGWIVFKAIGIGDSPLDIDLARYHPDHPNQTFDNFVRLGGQVDEPLNVPNEFASFCVKPDACEADSNGDGLVNLLDFGKLRADYGKDCTSSPEAPCVADFNGDGIVNLLDFGLLRRDYGRKDCLTCNP